MASAIKGSPWNPESIYKPYTKNITKPQTVSVSSPSISTTNNQRAPHAQRVQSRNQQNNSQILEATLENSITNLERNATLDTIQEAYKSMYDALENLSDKNRSLLADEFNKDANQNLLSLVGGVGIEKIGMILAKCLLHVVVDIATDAAEGVAGFRAFFGRHVNSTNARGVIELNHRKTVERFLVSQFIEENKNWFLFDERSGFVTGINYDQIIVPGNLQTNELKKRKEILNKLKKRNIYTISTLEKYIDVEFRSKTQEDFRNEYPPILHPDYVNVKQARKSVLLKMLQKLGIRKVEVTYVLDVKIHMTYDQIREDVTKELGTSMQSNTGTPNGLSSQPSTNSENITLVLNPQGGSRISYTKRSLKELRSLAKHRGVKGYSKMNKEALVVALKNKNSRPRKQTQTKN